MGLAVIPLFITSKVLTKLNTELWECVNTFSNKRQRRRLNLRGIQEYLDLILNQHYRHFLALSLSVLFPNRSQIIRWSCWLIYQFVWRLLFLVQSDFSGAMSPCSQMSPVNLASTMLIIDWNKSHNGINESQVVINQMQKKTLTPHPRKLATRENNI